MHSSLLGHLLISECKFDILQFNPSIASASKWISCVRFTTAVFFLEFWKRKEITLAYHWDVLEYESEEVIAKAASVRAKITWRNQGIQGSSIDQLFIWSI